MKTTIALLLFPIVLAAPAARADQLPDGEAATIISSPADEAPGTAEDPNIDRALLLPTAMTQPAGSATYNNYELLLHGFTYGITDRVQGSITVLAPIVQDMPLIGLASVKWRLLSASRLHVAVQGSAGVSQSFTGSNETSETLGAGSFASVCLRQDCSSLVSASLIYQVGLASGSTGQALIYGGSIIHGVSQHVKLLAEVTSFAGKSTATDGFDNVPGALVGYGVRLHGSSFAADVGFIKPILDSSDGGFLMGLPFGSISYRWM